ncbi:hypothetical protein CRG98_014333, partial [Punica granatum]
INLNVDAQELVQKCRSYQKFARSTGAPPSKLTPIPKACPFSTWGINTVGLLSPASRARKFVIVATDYFFKCVEVEAVTSINERAIIKFFTSLISRFCVPHALVLDNGAQFAGKELGRFYNDLQIEQRFASLGGSWTCELYNVIWSYKTTLMVATNEIPFSLVYGSKAVLLAKIGLHTYRVEIYNESFNDYRRAKELDTLEERRLEAADSMACAREAAAKYFNRKVKTRQFAVGDWVLRKNEFTRLVWRNKLTPK